MKDLVISGLATIWILGIVTYVRWAYPREVPLGIYHRRNGTIRRVELSKGWDEAMDDAARGGKHGTR